MPNQQPYKPTREAVIALFELVQDISAQRKLAEPEKYPTLHDAVLSVLGDAGHRDMAAMWRETR